MRNPRYKVFVAYATTNFNRFGKFENEELMTKDMLVIALKMLDPIKCREWLSHIEKLSRGMFYQIECLNGTEGLGQIYKQIRIVRN